MRQLFTGKTVFITGASAGIGAALALEFSRQGAHVAIGARRKDRLDKVIAQLESTGGKAIAVICDVTDRNSVAGAVKKTVDIFGGIDVAVANAGFGVRGVVEELQIEDFQRQFATNYFGLINTIKETLPYLQKTQGRLVLISSIAGCVSVPGLGAYCSSKYAVNGLAEALYYELAGSVSITCIQPGMVESDFSRVDSQGVFHKDRPETRPAMFLMPVTKAVRQMVRAIYRRRFDVVITLHGKLLVTIHRYFPRSFRWVSRVMGKKIADYNSKRH